MINTQPQTATMESCIDTCQQCHTVCLQMAMSNCLEQGGQHVEPEHFRLMLNCAEICQTAANFMLSQSPLHAVVCGACAEVCAACADSCEQVGDMDECASACRECAQHCEAMAGGSGGQSQPQFGQSQQQPLQ